MSENLLAVRTHIADLGRLLYQRGLTDTAGGNISARAGDKVCMTPKYAGGKSHWDLRPTQVLVLTPSGEKLEGEGQVSREALVHLRLYELFASAGAVVHSHAPNTLVFGAIGRPIPPVLEYVQRLGPVGFARYAPTHTAELAANVAEALEEYGHQQDPYAAATIVPGHGLFVVARDLDTAFDISERVEITARTVLLGTTLAGDAAWIERAQDALSAGRAGQSPES